MPIFKTRHADKAHYLVYSEGDVANFSKFYIIYESDEHYTINYGARGTVGKYLPAQDGNFACRINGATYKEKPNDAQKKLDKKLKEGYKAVSEPEFYLMHVKSWADGLGLLHVHGFFGLINEAGEVVVPPIYVDLAPCAGLGLWIAKRQDYHYGLINAKHQIVSPFVHHSLAFQPKTGDFLSKNSGGTFIMNANGDFIASNKKAKAPATPEAPISDPKTTKVVIEKDKKTKKLGLKNQETGKWVVSPKYSIIETFVNDYAVVYLDEISGIIDRNGNELIPPIYEMLRAPSEGFIAFRKDKLWGFLDLEGRQVIAPQYGWADSFSQGLAPFGDNLYPPRKYGYINTQGQQVVPPTYESAGLFGDGLAPVMLDNLYGYINTQGQLTIPCQYQAAEPFSDGLACVVGPDFACGYINTKGEMVIPAVYELGLSFANGVAPARKNNKWGVIDKKGNPVVDFIYDKIEGQGPIDGIATFKLKSKSVEINLASLS